MTREAGPAGGTSSVERRLSIPALTTRGWRQIVAAGMCLVASVGWAWRARAYDAATTNAGLTQRAVVASSLHQVLVRRLGRPLGLFEPIALKLERLPASRRRFLWGRLMALDPAWGYRPADDGVTSAVAWIMAGSVISKTPPERLQNMFFDPSTKMGLRDASAWDGLGHALRVAADSGGVRSLATGTSFAFEGVSSLDWLESPQNDLGLPALWEHVEQAVIGEEPEQRSVALVETLLSLGGVLAVLEDAGNPAQVRNDFRGAYLQGEAGSPFDRGPRYDRTVADLYGVQGVPAPRAAIRRATWKAYFSGSDGQGLADRTQRRFFSDGTVPEDAIVDHETSALDVATAARESLSYALPTVPRLDLRGLGQVRYVTTADGPGANPRALLGYERVPGRVRFFLDERVYADTARALLPEIAGYAAGLIDHLFRGSVKLSLSGRRVKVELVGSQAEAPAPMGRLVILAEDARGHRHQIGAFSRANGNRGLSAPVPSDARKIAVFARGEDAAGPLVAFAELALPPTP